jgi:hypothetical protein
MHQNVTTTDGKSGLVVETALAPGGRVVLTVEDANGVFFDTDNEHATIAR